MSARQIPIVELIAPYTTRRPAIHPVVGLTARLALLEAECRDFRRELNAAIETPFGTNPWEDDYRAWEAGADYAHDELEVAVEAGEE